MNCLESRRRLLAAPQHYAHKHGGHLAKCKACAALATQLERLDAHIADVASVRVPEGLAARIALARGRHTLGRSPWRAAAVAAIVVAGALVLRFADVAFEGIDAPPLAALGPSHPAVAAIHIAAAQRPAASNAPASVDLAAMHDGMRRLGLTFRNDDVKVTYAAKCYLQQADCDQIVVDTVDGPVTMFLVPDYPFDLRGFLSERSMTALISPAGNGGYIVVAANRDIAKRAEKLLVKG